MVEDSLGDQEKELPNDAHESAAVNAEGFGGKLSVPKMPGDPKLWEQFSAAAAGLSALAPSLEPPVLADALDAFALAVQDLAASITAT